MSKRARRQKRAETSVQRAIPRDRDGGFVSDEESSGYQWFTTAPDPRASGAAISGGSAVKGWKLHAVKATPDETARAIRFRKAVCGLLPAHGWDEDLFIEDRCSRCVRSLKLRHRRQESRPLAIASPGR